MACCACSNPNPKAVPAGDWFRLAVAGLVAGQSMVFGLAVNISPPDGPARLIIHSVLAVSAVVVFLLAGLPIWHSALAALMRGKVVIEQLFLLGIAGAFGASVHSTITGFGHIYYEVVAILVAIYTFGKLIGERRRSAALEAARSLAGEFDLCERLKADGETETVRAGDIAEGDRLIVRAGGAIPVDGEILEGVGFVQETALTGEPFPVVKRPGDSLLAGCFSVDGCFSIRSSAAGNARRLDALIARVREAQERPSDLQREADRIVAWFLPSVVVISLATFAFWTWRESWIAGLFNALAVVVVACPCSMGLATPVGIWSALGALAARGVIPRDSNLIERIARVDTVVFDKTGTLGEDELERVDFVNAASENRSELLAAVAALEASSNHPVARAFRMPGAVPVPSSSIPGAGIEGIVDNVLIRVGNFEIVPPDQHGAAEDLASELKGSSSHLVYVIRNSRVAGIAALREKLRDSARETIRDIESLGLRCLVMTGDRAEAAALHGLPDVHAGMTPLGKAELVADLKARGRKVLFVGDGVNDAPAMSEADVSFSVGSGSELARETASAGISDLRAIPFAIERCRQAVHAIRGNLIFAAAYNVVGITLAAAGILHPVAAALLMLASSFTVTWRALRQQSSPQRGVKIPRAKLLLCVALGLQGPAIVYLGGFRGVPAAGFIFLFSAAAILLAGWITRRPVAPFAGMALSMFSIGGLAMLAGWWGDAGFAPVVRDGVCLCGCASSNMGLGLFAKFGWMDASMLAASVPAIFLERPSRGRLWCWIAGLVGMLAGMEAASWLMAQIPVIRPQAVFFATYSAMMFGMCLGMVAACGAWQGWRRNP
ncbi:MAG: cation-translocating P-type ATPase [Verrucomicrobiaceae bacterium]|nr:MAG: cation-translocating P-type ATPase [Verrucomicrobiaceae bacterium]